MKNIQKKCYNGPAIVGIKTEEVKKWAMKVRWDAKNRKRGVAKIMTDDLALGTKRILRPFQKPSRRQKEYKEKLCTWQDERGGKIERRREKDVGKENEVTEVINRWLGKIAKVMEDTQNMREGIKRWGDEKWGENEGKDEKDWAESSNPFEQKIVEDHQKIFQIIFLVTTTASVTTTSNGSTTATSVAITSATSTVGWSSIRDTLLNVDLLLLHNHRNGQRKWQANVFRDTKNWVFELIWIWKKNLRKGNQDLLLGNVVQGFHDDLFNLMVVIVRKAP